ncbi:MAG: mechanosensitive ion channel family protein [Candidatus Latescibacterota bacterium]
MRRATTARIVLFLALALALVPAIAAAQPVSGPDSVAAPATAASRGSFESVWQFMGDLFGIASAAELRIKAMRIVVVLAIGVVAKVFMDVVQWVSRLLVYSDRGPLRVLFRNHQRSVTIHALVINLIKYVVYFTALGYILRELGIDYTTYLASLSLIGIAIGFGSQGLVQDVVTGFFILFEDQFSVGDMVEISGSVGLVEEIGLRTTRLRNYNGALVIFQNRNIPMVGLYQTGGMQAGVDVAVAGREQADRAVALLARLGREMHRQFAEIIMDPPEVLGVMELATGEVFVRLRLTIWPMQQWVVDAQLVPRIRALLQAEGLEIPGDRVVSFFHFPKASPREENGARRLRHLFERVRRGVSAEGKE